MKFTEKRTINAYDLRNFCIEWNLYTNGSNEEYEKLLFDNKIARKFAKQQNITINDIYSIALDIIAHSEQAETDLFLEIENVMHYIVNDICKTHFEVVFNR